MYTKNTTFDDLLTDPKMATLRKYYIGEPEGDGTVNPISEEMMRGVSFEQMCALASPAWNPDAMAMGFNALQELLNRGVPVETGFRGYAVSDEDWEANHTGLLWMPANPETTEPKPFVILCAGGAYEAVCSIQESFPVAAILNRLGIDAFVLQYHVRTRAAAWKSIRDLALAVRFILDRKERYHVNESYAVFGFSAGGHLTAEFGTENFGYGQFHLPKPELLVLSYPFVSFRQMGETEKLMAARMAEGDVTETLMESWSPCLHIGSDYPRTFIWATKEDEMVPYEENALAMYEALRKRGIPSRLKSVEHGRHGLGCALNSEAWGWIDEAVAFWKEEKEWH